MDIYRALRESHERQRSMADALLLTRGGSPERQQLYQQLKQELKAHALAEERYFYIPLMMEDQGVSLSRHSIAEHHELDELFETLDDTELSSPGWLAHARTLHEKLFHHLKEEEHKFFQMSGKLLGERRKEELGHAYQWEYRQALRKSLD